MAQPKPLYLVDGSSYLFRAYHALPPLSTSRGEPTGALYGVANMLRKWVKDEDPELLGVVFDAPGKTFRDDIYPEYKANRPPMPDDLRAQLAPLLELIEAMGMPLLKISGVEADDVIGTLARQGTAEGRKVVISTSDKDLAQLVDDNVTLVNTMSNTRLNIQGVIDKFGVHPDQIIDYLALIGDSVDNVPGVNKVGPKTAAKWLAQYKTLDAIMADADSFKGKIGQYLRDALDQLPLSRELVTIKEDVELSVSADDLVLRDGDYDKLRTLYSHWEFTGWLRELEESGPAPEAKKVSVETITDLETLEDWVERLGERSLIAMDVERDRRDPVEAKLVGIALCTEPGTAAYIPIGHADASGQLAWPDIRYHLEDLLASHDVSVVGHEFKDALIVLERHGLPVPSFRHDTMLQSYVLNSTASRHDLDALAERYLQRATTAVEDLVGKGTREISFSEVSIEEAARYAGEDAEVTLALHRELTSRLEEHEGPRSVYANIEIPLSPVLARIEARGVLVDKDQLDALSEEFAARMEEVETKAYEVAGETFNIGSTKQLGELLFDNLGLPVIRKTPKGKPSTAEDVLEELGKDYELPSLIIEHRALQKLKSTYTDSLPTQINPDTGRIHTSYHQAIAATGRLSSTDPNLQNIPIRTEAGRRIRKAFVAPDGYRIVAADYSQIELRIMAHLSADKGLLKAFRDGLDIHAATAAEVFGGDPETIASEKRRAAKAINFGLIYGMSAFGLAKQLGIARKEAQEYIDIYFGRYPGVAEYMEKTRQFAYEHSYVETVFGRRLYLPEIRASNYQRREASKRAAINAPMQGTAADIIKRAMIDVDGWLGGDDAIRMTMQVHDELVFEVRESHIDDFMGQITRRMAGAAELDVPLVVDVGVGDNWDEAR